MLSDDKGMKNFQVQTRHYIMTHEKDFPTKVVRIPRILESERGTVGLGSIIDNLG